MLFSEMGLHAVFGNVPSRQQCQLTSDSTQSASFIVSQCVGYFRLPSLPGHWAAAPLKSSLGWPRVGFTTTQPMRRG